MNTYWLSLLLVGSIPPILKGTLLTEVSFQTEILGWHTDDFLLRGEYSDGSYRLLAGQVKRSFTVSLSDDECRKAVLDFWKDYRKGKPFRRDIDAFALVCLRGTNTLLEDFSALLDCARAARSDTEFLARLTTDGFISAKSRTFYDTVRRIICDYESCGRTSAVELWPFLKALHVLSLDLNSSTGQSEAQAKTLLAASSVGPDSIASAEASWNSLLEIVVAGMPQAQAFMLRDFPDGLREKHSPVTTHAQSLLADINQHSRLVLEGISTQIGSCISLDRFELHYQITEKLQTTSVLVISGPAGSGKSGVAKRYTEGLEADNFLLAFRAEEFAKPHLDEVLASNNLPINSSRLVELLASQSKKYLLIESAERLLEAPVRDAFADLISIVSRDQGWKVILTCRDYSLDLFQSSFLGSVKLPHSVLRVPPVGEDELELVQTAFPALRRPLSNDRLRGLMSNPYILDKSLRIDWDRQTEFPETEREFRELFWREIVRVNHFRKDGLPNRRERTFQDLALRRARALTPYVDADDLDAEALEALLKDSLVDSNPNSQTLVRTSHDVLEDWAILHWLDKQYALNGSSVHDMALAVGQHPAVRRTFRKWLVEIQGAEAARIFEQILQASGLPDHFRDDTLVSLLQSPAAPAFLRTNSDKLFEGQAPLIHLIMHLLRIGSMKEAEWGLPGIDIPSGQAWPVVLELIVDNQERIEADQHLQVLGFLEDWAKGISVISPYPAGANTVSKILRWLRLSSRRENRRDDEFRERILKLLSKIPKADPRHFLSLLKGPATKRGAKSGRTHRAPDELRKLLLEGFGEGAPAARDFPVEMIEIAENYLLLTDAELANTKKHEWQYTDVFSEPLFGFSRACHSGYLPASSLHGPYWSLLQYHGSLGLTFLLRVFDHSLDFYANPRGLREGGTLGQLRLQFADGSEQIQWCDSRLWNLYRGTSIGPDILKSLLMVLERWLLVLGESEPELLDPLLLQILRTTTSGAVTAVVASVATAYSHYCVETVLVLLSEPLVIRLDRQRLAEEVSCQSGFELPYLKAVQQICADERRRSDQLPHRRRDLELTVLQLQLGKHSERLQQILDRHRANLPSTDEQGDDDRTWRISLHRMDLRSHEPTLVEAEASDGEDTIPLIRLDVTGLEPDVKAVSDQAKADFDRQGAKYRLHAWGHAIFARKESLENRSSDWLSYLQQAMQIDWRNENAPARGGVGYISAVCIRDHWEDLSVDHKNWCVSTACAMVTETADLWNGHDRIQRFSMGGDRPTGYILPLLLSKSLDQKQKILVERALPLALTHAVEEVRQYFVGGLSTAARSLDFGYLRRCADTLALETSIVEAEMKRGWATAFREPPTVNRKGRRQPFLKLGSLANAIDGTLKRFKSCKNFVLSRFRRQPKSFILHQATVPAYHSRVAEFAAVEARRLYGGSAELTEGRCESYTLDATYSIQRYVLVLTILKNSPRERLAIHAFNKLAAAFTTWWDRSLPGRFDESDIKRHFEAEPVLMQILCEFLLKADAAVAANMVEPFVRVMKRNPREVSGFIEQLVSAEIRQSAGSKFWELWQVFGDALKGSDILEEIDDDYGDIKGLLSAVFLGHWWNESIDHWSSLEGYDQMLHTLFDELPLSAALLQYYVRFIYMIGSRSLPNAFLTLSNKLRRGSKKVLRGRETEFHLTRLLEKYVYRRPLEVKQSQPLREAVLYLLDELVNNGSSRAFRMRDDFLTPVHIA